ncbi:MAG TPA: FAD-dependent oxidoreductase [Polyangiaceae bacterium]|nr:FAD-dependent oxidoreductase [Polyangiaceae bacterium]
MGPPTHQADVVIAGAGLAGIVTAYELLEHGMRVLLIDKDRPERLGGLAKESFGGVHMIDTPHQRRTGIRDDPELAWKDWQRCAHFGTEDRWPKAWAKLYCEASIEFIWDFLAHKKVRFLPIVNWVERGIYRPHNSVPRWHVTWGTGWEIVSRLVAALDAHPRRRDLQILFGHEVNGIESSGGRATALVGRRMDDGSAFRATGEHLVVASGGICGGDLSKLRANWYSPWGTPPEVILNGAHDYGDGLLHDRVQALGGRLTHMDKQWHYPAGIHKPGQRRPNDGISLVPPRSALWVNARGERIGPTPLVSYTDTRYLVERICGQPGQYSWQVLNRTIALKELGVSGCDYMTAFRFKKKLLLAKHLVFGNDELVDRLIAECPDDIVVADSLADLVDKMNERGLGGYKVDLETLESDIREYDDQIDRGPGFYNDEQLRRISVYMNYRGDKVRTCNFQKILDPKARPLMAIREFILARKSLGGIQTDLRGRVLRPDGACIEGLYAVGEAAGFGGGGIHGLGSLEGTFLGACVLTGRAVARAIAGKPVRAAAD